MKTFQQNTAPAAMFHSSGRQIWQFAYSEELIGTAYDKKYSDRMLLKVEDDNSELIAQLIAAGAVEVIQ